MRNLVYLNAGGRGSGKTQCCRQLVHRLATRSNDVTYEFDSHTVQDFLTWRTTARVEPEVTASRRYFIYFDSVNQNTVHTVNQLCSEVGRRRHVFILASTKDCSLAFTKPVEHLSPMTMSQCQQLKDKLIPDKDCTMAELFQLMTMVDGSPLGLVSCFKQMLDVQCSFSQYMKDYHTGFETCSFFEGEYENNKSLRKVLVEELGELEGQLSAGDWQFLVAMAYMGRTIPVDVLETSAKGHLNSVSASNLIKCMQQRSVITCLESSPHGRCIVISPVAKDLLQQKTLAKNQNLELALSILLYRSSKDVRFKMDFDLQLLLLDSINSLRNHIDDANHDVVSDLKLTILYTAAGHMFCQLKKPKRALQSLDNALQAFAHSFLKTGPIGNLDDLLKGDRDITEIARELFGCIKCTRVCMPEHEKAEYYKFIERFITSQRVAADHLAYSRSILGQEDIGVDPDEQSMNRGTYEVLVRKDLAVALPIMLRVFPYEVLASLLYTRGRLRFYNISQEALRHDTFYRRQLQLCHDMCDQVKASFKVNLLHKLISQTNGLLYFLIDEEQPNPETQRVNCRKAVESYKQFIQDSSSYYEYGLLKSSLAYKTVVYAKQVVKVHTILSRNMDKNHKNEALGDLQFLKEKLRELENCSQLTHDGTVYLEMGKLYLSWFRSSNDQLSVQAAVEMFEKVCQRSEINQNTAIVKEWLEAVKGLAGLMMAGQLPQSCQITQHARVFLQFCQEKQLTGEYLRQARKLKKQVVEYGGLKPVSPNLECVGGEPLDL